MGWSLALSTASGRVHDGSPSRTEAISTLVVAWCSLILSYQFIFFMLSPASATVQRGHEAVWSRTADSPEAYRVLVPWAVEAGRPLLELFARRGHTATMWGYALYVVIGYAMSLMLLLRVYRRLLPGWLPLGGLLLTTLSMVVAMGEPQMPSIVEPGIYAAAVLLILRGSRLGYLALVAIASLNRETACFLVLLFVLTGRGSWKRRSHWLWAAAYLAVWAAAFGSLRMAIGWRPHSLTLTQIFQANMQSLAIAIPLKVFLFLGPFWLCVRRGWRVASAVVQGGVLTFGCFVIFGVPWAYWSETRLWMPYYAVLVPLVLGPLQGPDGVLLGWAEGKNERATSCGARAPHEAD